MDKGFVLVDFSDGEAFRTYASALRPATGRLAACAQGKDQGETSLKRRADATWALVTLQKFCAESPRCRIQSISPVQAKNHTSDRDLECATAIKVRRFLHIGSVEIIGRAVRTRQPYPCNPRSVIPLRLCCGCTTYALGSGATRRYS